ncbi:MAG: LamG-like jellyroll fold domain-containing protein [Candidatus Sumerlaeia bacterium]
MRRLLITIASLLLIAVANICIAQDFSWQKPHAKVLPTGDLEWAPEAFAYKPGNMVRYIDFENGNDSNDGATQATAWKHHPWDPAASGGAKSGARGVDTFVFKQGVTYRGHMNVPAGTKGSDDHPIRLTRDPAWGEGEARIYGSEVVTGWQKGSSHPDIPEAEKVWTAKLDFLPRALWMVDAAGDITRIDLAKTPNWTISDPEDVMSEWWEWEQPEWWKHMGMGDPRAQTKNKGQGIVGIDKKNLTREPDYYEDAVVRTEWGIVMGMPMPSRVEHFDRDKGMLSFTTPFLGPGFLITGQRYFLEDKPHYLDIPGEFWFERKGRGGVLHVRLPGDMDPNTVTMEAAKRINLIDSKGMSHFEVSGLTFRFTNYLWNYEWYPFQDPDVRGACVRLLGGGEDVRVSHCNFEHVSKAVRIEAPSPGDRLDKIVVSDNDIRFTDHSAMYIQDHTGGWGNSDPSKMSRLVRVEVLRNRLFEITQRFARMEHGHAIQIQHPEDCVVAGNIVDRTWGGGIEVVPAKGDRQLRDAPFARLLVFHNKVSDSLLASNDWGAIRINQGGPGYIYNNVVRNVGGFANWRYRQGKKEGTLRFGHSYYLDGSYKKYVFNNIAWGRNNEQGSKYANESAFQTLISFENQIFNNTAYRFVQASRNQSGALGRWLYLGNVFQDVSQYVFRHANPPKEKDPNAADAGKQGDVFDYATYGYKNNLFYDIRGSYGMFEASGQSYDKLDPMREAMKAHELQAWQIGVNATEAPLKDPAEGDMRPVKTACPEGAGAVRVFVPWPLYRVVGEWHFNRNNADPSHVVDHHWYMQPRYPGRQEYIKMPRFPLMAPWASKSDYVKGGLENWTDGALVLRGEPLVLKRTKDQEISYANKKGGVSAEDLPEILTVDMGQNSFIIEATVRVDGEDGVLVEKMGNEVGYRLSYRNEGLLMELGGAGNKQNVQGPALKVGASLWHHVLVEVDREDGKVRFYVNGKLTTEENFNLDGKTSFSNDADFQVGRNFKGALDFLRISRGSLKDARTTIEELYEWETNGPFLRDFAGRDRDFDKGAPGAIEYE